MAYINTDSILYREDKLDSTTDTKYNKRVYKIYRELAKKSNALYLLQCVYIHVKKCVKGYDNT